MKLSTYISRNYKNLTEAAQASGISRATLSRYSSGLRIPSREHMPIVYSWTSGAVQPNDFYDLPDLGEAADGEAAA